MKEDEGKTKEVEANPYNQKKSWHTDDVMPQTFVGADSGPADANTEPVRQGLKFATDTKPINPNSNQETDAATSDKSLQESALVLILNLIQKLTTKNDTMT